MIDTSIISKPNSFSYNNAKQIRFVEATICFLPTRPTPFIVRR